MGNRDAVYGEVRLVATEKYLRTGRLARWSRLRDLCGLIPLAIALPVFLAILPGSGVTSVIGVLAVVVISLAVGAFTGMPVLAVCFTLCSSMVSRTRAEARFVATRDITYYRETLKGVSPVLLSMVSDLRVEPRKDIAASLLSLQMRHIVSFGPRGIEVTDAMADDVASLVPSDAFLVSRLRQGGISAADFGEWSRLAEREALSTSYLLRYGFGGAMRLSGCASGCLEGCAIPMLCVIVALMVGALALTGGLGPAFEAFSSFIAGPGRTRELVALVEHDPGVLVPFILLSLSLLMGVYGTLYLFVSAIVTAVRSSVRTNDIRRTAAGDVLAECAFGLKNYLSDFTCLSDADRRALVLWDDFFVYAVVLDVNERAAREVLPLKGVSLDELLAAVGERGAADSVSPVC